MSESPTTGNDAPTEQLSKELSLFDVYAICTGAMFSSGFFLLPGIAAAETGPSVVFAYLLSGLLIMPAALCVAELSTAMPKAGGAYYFLDRSLGPVVGASGGVSTWVALILKSAFALVGMGAYLAIFVDLPIKPVAVALIVAFTALNIIGAKESSGLQQILVATLVAVLAYFVVQGLFEVFSASGPKTARDFEEWFPFGLSGLFSTVGMVFVSYAGLTKVASVSEEVKDPDRNIPLGMLLSLATAIVIYTVGVFVMVDVLDPSAFREDLTPVATAGQAFFDWLPGEAGLWLIVIAAIAAFASTGNAGIMSASRYPLAMARDKLVPSFFGKIGRFDTPTIGILATGGLMIFVVVALDVATLAKLASAIQLLLFAMICLAVIVMRESQLEFYQPGFRTPLYPWLPLIGVTVPFWLIVEMGTSSILFSGGVLLAAVLWYFFYSQKHVERQGAIYHVFERLGEQSDEELSRELRLIISRKGNDEDELFEETVANAQVLGAEREATFEELLVQASNELSALTDTSPEELAERFLQEAEAGLAPRQGDIVIPHLRIGEVEHSYMVIMKTEEGIKSENGAQEAISDDLAGLIFLVSPIEQTGQHLRLLAQIATRVEAPDFLARWYEAQTEVELKALLLRDERSLKTTLPGGSAWAGKTVSEFDVPEGALLALIRRGSSTLIPNESTRLQGGDELLFVGDTDAIEQLEETFDV
jgi:amino acid transporter/mannitol/fructose-specific phosphotransferase system IIA component (Ntr-type)